MSDRAADAARLRELLKRTPGDRVSWHNLAAAEGDLGQAIEAETAARRAIALGVIAPETRLVLARALQSQRRLDEAERAFEEALAIRPAYVEAHRDLAQLVWMRTGAVNLALQRLERTIRAAPLEIGLHLVRSVVLEFAGDLEGGLGAAEAGLAVAPTNVALLRQAAHLCADLGDPMRAVALAKHASTLAPGDAASEISVCEALLAAGQIVEADGVIRTLRAKQPLNQYVMAIQATIWRQLGDPRYAVLHDYGAMLGIQRLEVPGWASLDTFLSELALDLEGLHVFSSHPLQQSVRGGSQITLQHAEMSRPLVRALFTAIKVAVLRHLAKLGPGEDPFRSRNTGAFATTGAWSVRLRSGGFHADHVHPHGWLSSACYIALPTAIGPAGGTEPERSGWLRLGRPGINTSPTLAAEHFVKPEPGLLVLFPAYMWHGVEPFESDEPRLSVAFDVVPA